MADLSVAQRAALAQLIAACPDHLLSQLEALAATMTGDRAWALRDMVEAEVLDRRRRDAAFAPLTPLFRRREDGLEGLSFPAGVPTRLWKLATRNEPELLPQLDRDDELSRMVADRLCLSAASAVRDQGEGLWPGASADEAAELAACFDLAGLARRSLTFLETWLGRPGPEATAELKLALRQAGSIAPDGAARLMEIFFAHLSDARMMLRLVAQATPAAGRETVVGESELAVFVDRVVTALAHRAAQAAAFDPTAVDSSGRGADAALLKADLDWCAETLAEIDMTLPLRADSAWGKAVRQARLKIALRLSELFSAAEKATAKVLPVERTAIGGRMTRPAPRLDEAVDATAADKAKALAAVIGLVRGPATVFGCEAERRQTAEGLTGKLATWADEAIERLNDGEAPNEGIARKRIALTAELLGLIGARDAQRTVRRRLTVAGAPPSVAVEAATSGASRRRA
ncbi:MULTISPECIES: hypothetical protein [unclassified Brevundimonas]|uniref:hypothetical protein n=1 Tax=unclassified Brevundimonas TaxID=2622653 RepID=UPI000CFC40B2|nr:MULTISPECIES: hypothetical protein [unclassified Brevundimonas]PRA27095.1 hypothetical protein CQ024_11945 [Brevundimonas sp. MYb27]PQZ83788.1 hypothetical protein CQ026_03065 [Brevundimonas sp. MYb31]PRB13147.1 hypothetical protein CQ039_13135 [Brevundimonas sp. MYb52]PRB33772.1 hypothetical protein CQ035_12150 [Brevundimonas sp. MYb46]PRB42520.1 hypothetical protein CQ028_14880 [Brevundimonas sp. MYb33]